jgi:hypothetical protein
MRVTRSIAAVACGALLLAAPATAQTTADRVTVVTFSGPVSIPGKTLPAGSYTFRLADSPGDRHIVQIFDRDQSQILATLLAVPAERTEVEGNPVITFKETPADRPPAVHYWYYAGERAGNEFVYPKSQAMMIARASGEPVMSIDSESTNLDDWKGQPTRITADAEPQAATTGTTAATAATASTTSTTSDTTTAAAQPPASPAAAAAQPTTTAPQTPAQPERSAAAPATQAPDRPVGTSGRADTAALPHTASGIPAVGLLGAFALAGALALRLARRSAV